MINFFWHFVISNIESLNVKYNLSNNMLNVHPHTAAYKAKEREIVTTAVMHRIEVIILTNVNIMVKIHAT